MTVDEARGIYAAGEGVVVETLLGLDCQIRALKERLCTDSHNSSKPPSTDGYHKPEPKSRRVRTGRKPGGQKGHPGTTLALSEHPDTVVVHPVHHCGNCELDLSGRDADGVELRQVLDIPPPRMEVTEHRLECKTCPRCLVTTTADAPEGVNAPVQYGPRMRALGVYLKEWQLLPFKRAAELIRTIFGSSLSEGTLANMVRESSLSLDAPLQAIKSLLTDADVVNFDESGCMVCGKLHWIHVAANGKVTLYHIHPKRGANAMEEMGVLPGFTGTAIHDHWKAYYTFTECKHALCNAHHLRELTFVHETVGQEWAKLMMDLLLNIQSLVDEAKGKGCTKLDKSQIAKVLRRYNAIIVMGLEVNPAPVPIPGKRGKPADSKAGNLVRRLEKHRREVLAFMYDFEVDFTNNRAERDIRMVKVQQKVSGTFRSDPGSESFGRIRSYLSTACKQGISAYEALFMALSGMPFMPEAS